MKEKTIKCLQYNKWYHATSESGFQSICTKGVISEHNIGHELDFGYGFYLCPTQDAAENYIARLKDMYPDEELVIIEFDFCPFNWFQGSDFNTRVFENYDDEFAEFVLHNRTKNVDGENQHTYDCIFGVMSDSFPTRIVQDYKAGVITKERAIEELKKSTSVKQISLHNQTLCDTLTITRAYAYDSIHAQRKELDINGYR